MLETLLKKTPTVALLITALLFTPIVTASNLENLAQSLALLKEEITYSLKKTSAQAERLLEKALES